MARGHPGVLAEPPPQVILNGFRDSALEVELAVWTLEMIQHQRRFRSDLNFAIDAAFRAAGVTIPFPQRDVRIRPVDVSPAGASAKRDDPGKERGG